MSQRTRSLCKVNDVDMALARAAQAKLAAELGMVPRGQEAEGKRTLSITETVLHLLRGYVSR